MGCAGLLVILFFIAIISTFGWQILLVAGIGFLIYYFVSNKGTKPKQHVSKVSPKKEPSRNYVQATLVTKQKAASDVPKPVKKPEITSDAQVDPKASPDSNSNISEVDTEADDDIYSDPKQLIMDDPYTRSGKVKMDDFDLQIYHEERSKLKLDNDQPNPVFEKLYANIPESTKKILWIANGPHKNFEYFPPSAAKQVHCYIEAHDELSALFETDELEPGTPESFRGQLDLFNTYSSFTPKQRYHYLEWLSNPHAGEEFQYPWLLYQGMERHMVLKNLDVAFHWFEFIVYTLDYVELGGYLFSDTLYAYAKFKKIKYMRALIDPKDLDSRDLLLYKLLIEAPFDADDVSYWMWKVGLPENDLDFTTLKEYTALRSYYLPLAIQSLYGTLNFKFPSTLKPKIYINSGIGENEVKSGFNQYFFGNISTDLERQRIMWVQPMNESDEFKNAIKELVHTTAEFIRIEFKRRKEKGLKIRNAKVKNMYNPFADQTDKN